MCVLFFLHFFFTYFFDIHSKHLGGTNEKFRDGLYDGPVYGR